jgi:hypothetical protein
LESKKKKFLFVFPLSWISFFFLLLKFGSVLGLRKFFDRVMWEEAPAVEEDAKIIDKLFREYVPRDRTFDAQLVTKKTRPGRTQFSGTWGTIPAMDEVSLTYEHQDVKIQYYRRQTNHLGDVDAFVDTKVVVGGIIVHDETFQ